VADGVLTEIAGRRVRLTNLDKVLYPAVGFTKAEVIDYYTRVSAVMLPHVEGRALTFRRWPNGVREKPFFEKNCPDHRPGWVRVLPGPGDVTSCTLEETAAFAWAGNQAALEIHVPMARGEDLATPTALVFDLDPGAPADVVTCARVAGLVRDVLASVGLEAWAKTSGSKGLQLMVPLHTPTTHEHAGSFALAVGQLLERQRPDLVLTEMTKAKRPGKVFVDWSQNSFHKTTIGAYSLRGLEEPTVSTPVDWDELEDATSVEDLRFSAPDVLERVERSGDLFAPVATLEQELPRTRS
jgi:bifunctional non-homologous end joining protein LigD